MTLYSQKDFSVQSPRGSGSQCDTLPSDPTTSISGLHVIRAAVDDKRPEIRGLSSLLSERSRVWETQNMAYLSATSNHPPLTLPGTTPLGASDYMSARTNALTELKACDQKLKDYIESIHAPLTEAELFAIAQKQLIYETPELESLKTIFSGTQLTRRDRGEGSQ
jgi:hypothetical protein